MFQKREHCTIFFVQRRPLHDTTATNALTKFEASITKKFGEQLRDFSEEQYRKLEELHDLFEFLDDIIPEDDEDEVPKKKSSMPRKRYHCNIDSVFGLILPLVFTGDPRAWSARLLMPIGQLLWHLHALRRAKPSGLICSSFSLITNMPMQAQATFYAR
jgi:hypothetical protein